MSGLRFDPTHGENEIPPSGRRQAENGGESLSHVLEADAALSPDSGKIAPYRLSTFLQRPIFSSAEIFHLLFLVAHTSFRQRRNWGSRAARKRK
jgi:hypothetical protein